MAITSRLLWSAWCSALPLLFAGCAGVNGAGTKTPDVVSQPDFSITMPSSVSVIPNSTETISISIAGINGFSGSANVSLSGLPAAVTAAPATFTLSPDASQTVVITAANNAAPGPVPLTVSATSGSITHTAITSTHQADFALAGPAANVALTAGGTAQINIATYAFNGFSGQVATSLAGLPAGVTASFSSQTLTPATPQTITLTAAAGVATGTATLTGLTLLGTSGTLSHNLEFSIMLSPPVAAPDFSVSMSPTALTLAAGGNAGQVALTMSAQNGFTGSASVTLSGLPSGVAAQPSSFVLSPGGSQAVAFSAGSTNQAQTANITFTAASPGLTHTSTLPLTITQPAPGFNLQVTPGSLTLTQGGPAQTLSILANATNGFAAQVNLGFSGSANVTVSPNSVTLTPGSAQTVNVSAAANATAGANTLIVTGTSGFITQTSSIPVTVNSSAPDFTLSVYPSVINLTPGGGGYGPAQPLELLATPLNQFSEPIAVTFSGWPAAIQWTGGALPLAPGIPQETQLAQSAGAFAGSATVTVTATSPTITHTAQFTVNTSDTVVPDFAFFAVPTALLLAPGQTSLSIAPDGFNGFTGQISTELTGVPAGTSADFSSGELTANTGLTVTITVPPGTAPSSGVLVLKGTAGALTHETDIPYSIVANAEVIQYAGPATLTLNQGSTENILLGTETTLAGNITTTANALPAGVTSPFFSSSGFSLSGNEVQGIYLPLTAAMDAPVGQTTLTFTSTDGTNTTTSQVLLNVVSDPNFTLNAPASLTVPAGGTGTFSLEATAINGFSGSVTAGLTGANGLSASPATLTLTPGVAQQITVTATAAATNGAIAIAATSGTLSQNLQVPITVGPVGPSYTITEPIGVLQLGTYVDSTFQISTASGIPLPANAQITGFPAGLLLAEAQDQYGDTRYAPGTTLNYLSASCPVSPQPCKASYFSIFYDGAAAGTYPLTLTATWDSITQTIPLTLVVIPPDFTVAVSPQTLTIVPGTTQTLTAAVGLNLSGSVSLTLENLPAGVTASPQVILTSSGNATFSVTASPQAALGSATLTLVGDSALNHAFTTVLPPGSPGAPAHTVQIPLTIAPSPLSSRQQVSRTLGDRKGHSAGSK